MRKALSTLGVAALALTLGACGGDDDKAAEKIAEDIVEGLGGEGVDIDIDTDGDDSGSITFDDGEGGESTISFGGGELPDELKDFPLPDDSKVIGSLSGEGAAGQGAMVSIAANGDFTEVVDQIESGLEDFGMTISDKMSAESEGKKTAIFTATGNGRSWLVTIGEDDTNEGYNLAIGIVTEEDAIDASE